jgi:hypothetical protein
MEKLTIIKQNGRRVEVETHKMWSPGWPKHGCGGTWIPVKEWTGRYRCDKCKCFGYRQGAAPKTTKPYFTPETVIPYKCKTRGCSGLAVKKNKISSWRGISERWACSKHAKQD